jgi:hypothetical protein
MSAFDAIARPLVRWVLETKDHRLGWKRRRWVIRAIGIRRWNRVLAVLDPSVQ